MILERFSYNLQQTKIIIDQLERALDSISTQR